MMRTAAALVALVTLLLTMVAVNALGQIPKVTVRLPLQHFPTRVADWQGYSEFFDPKLVAGLRMDDYILRTYQNRSGRSLWLYVAYYESQPGDARVHSPTVCLPAAGWFIAASGTSAIETSAGAITVNRNLIQRGGESQVVLYWYRIHGRVAARELQAISLLAWMSITQRRTDEAIARINAPIANSIDETTREEIAFAQATFLELRRFLP